MFHNWNYSLFVGIKLCICILVCPCIRESVYQYINVMYINILVYIDKHLIHFKRKYKIIVMYLILVLNIKSFCNVIILTIFQYLKRYTYYIICLLNATQEYPYIRAHRSWLVWPLDDTWTVFFKCDIYIKNRPHFKNSYHKKLKK